MAGIRHLLQSAKSDGVDDTLVRPSDWNDDHDLPSGSVVQVVVANSTTRFDTTSTSLQDTGLQATITPKYDDSILLVRVSGTFGAQRTSGSLGTRYAFVAIYNSTDAVLLLEHERGRTLVGTNTNTATSFMGIDAEAPYTVDSTAARTFKFQIRTNSTDLNAIMLADRTGGVTMTITEIRA